MSESPKCAICGSNAGLQGAQVKEKGKNDAPINVICGLHLAPDGLSLKKGEAVGDWEVLENWGYDGAVQPRASALEYFDALINRVLQNSGEGWGWKIVATVGDVTLEASTFPKGPGGARPPSPFVKVPSGPTDVSKINWRSNPDKPGFFWEFVANQDGTSKPEMQSLLAAIRTADKGIVTIDGYDYKLGKDTKFINKVKSK